jgi:hypothetical protein
VLYATPAALSWVRAAPVVKQVDFGGPAPTLDALRAAGPGAIKLFRMIWSTEEQNALLAAGAAGAAEAVTRILARLGNYRDPLLYVELLNETHQRLDTGLAEHVAFVAAATPRLHAAGLRVAAYSFSAGGYEWADASYLASRDYGGLDPARDALSIHEYWETIPFDGVFALRYRGMLHANAQANGTSHPPLLITECGRGRFSPVADPHWGWRSAGLAANVYVAELAAYDRALQEDDYVLGATAFTAGASYDGSQLEWSGFDTDSLNVAVLRVPPAPNG